MRWLILGLTIALASCSNRGELLGTLIGPDAAGPDGAPGVPLGAFAAPIRLDTLSSGSEDQDPTLPADELEIFFESNRAGSRDLWTSVRASTSDTWPPPTAVDELNSTAIDEDPAISADGLSIWFVSDRAGGFETVWLSTRTSRRAVWAPPRHVLELDAASNLRAPALDEQQLNLAFVAEQGPIGGSDILVAKRSDASGSWQTPQPVREIDTTYNDWDPWLGPSDLEIFWADDQRQIRAAYRASVSEPFGSSTLIEGIGSPAGDPTLSFDLRHLVFSSDRAGNYDLYEAFR